MNNLYTKIRVIVFSGSSGFVGSEVLKSLIRNSDKDERILCIINNSFPSIKNKKLIFINGDSKKAYTWERIFEEFDVGEIILTSNIRHVEALLNYLKKIKIVTPPRLMVLGTTGVHSKFKDYCSEYKRLENLISLYKGPYVVIRPTMIYGSSRDTNFHKLIEFILRFKIFFVFSNGNSLLRPIYYKDLSKVFIRAYKDKKINGYFDVAGNTTISYENLLKTIFAELNLKPIIINLPHKYVLFIIRLIEYTKIKLPITSEQLLRLQEDKTFNIDKARKILGFNPIGIRQGIKLQLKSMQKDKN